MTDSCSMSFRLASSWLWHVNLGCTPDQSSFVRVCVCAMRVRCVCLVCRVCRVRTTS
jgi:hypothetical protein